MNIEKVKDKVSEYKGQTLNFRFNGSRNQIEEFHKELGLAMSVEDLLMIRDYFKSEEKVPTITEIKVKENPVHEFIIRTNNAVPPSHKMLR